MLNHKNHSSHSLLIMVLTKVKVMLVEHEELLVMFLTLANRFFVLLKYSVCKFCVLCYFVCLCWFYFFPKSSVVDCSKQ